MPAEFVTPEGRPRADDDMEALIERVALETFGDLAKCNLPPDGETFSDTSSTFKGAHF